MVALEAPPATQAEVIPRVLCRVRPTLYLTTVRSAREVEEELEADAARPGVQDYPDQVVATASPESLLASPDEWLDNLGQGWNLIVDTVTLLEKYDEERYLPFLNAVKRRLVETGSLGVLFGAKRSPEPASRWLTLQRADVTWQLYRQDTSREVETVLVMGKFRQGKPIDEPQKLVLTDEVRVDTSRDIS